MSGLRHRYYTLSEAWSGVIWADLMDAQGAFGTDFYDRSILRPKHRAYYRSGRSVIKVGPKGALGSHKIRPIHSAPSLGQSIKSPLKILNSGIYCLKKRWESINCFTCRGSMFHNSCGKLSKKQKIVWKIYTIPLCSVPTEMKIFYNFPYHL